MPYIGNQPGTGVRSRFIYTATASQTTFTGADDNSKTLKYADSDYIDVFLNGVCLVPGTDYTASTKTSVVLVQAASVSDTLEVVAYDIASIADTVSKADGGTFNGDLGITNASPDITLTNNTTEDTDGGRESTVTFKGLQSGGEESTLAEIRASHDATADDQKGDLIFKTNDGSDGSSPTERLRIDSAGFLDSVSTSNDIARFSGTNSGSLTFRNDTSNEFQMHTGTSDALIFGTNGENERMRIDSDGKVGIGTSAPDGQLHLFTSDASISPDADADDLIIEANGAAGMIYYSHISNFMRFDTGAAERMRIDSSGNLLVAKTATDGSVVGHELRAMGTAIHTASADVAVYARRMSNDGAVVVIQGQSGTVGTISISGSSTSYNTSSDYRLKENVADITDGITRVKQLEPKKFNFIADADTTVDGFLAHEAATVVPEAVTGAKDAMMDEEYEVSSAELDDSGKIVK